MPKHLSGGYKRSSMNMATSMIDLSILYGAPVHLFITGLSNECCQHKQIHEASKDDYCRFICLLGPTQGNIRYRSITVVDSILIS